MCPRFAGPLEWTLPCAAPELNTGIKFGCSTGDYWYDSALRLHPHIYQISLQTPTTIILVSTWDQSLYLVSFFLGMILFIAERG